MYNSVAKTAKINRTRVINGMCFIVVATRKVAGRRLASKRRAQHGRASSLDGRWNIKTCRHQSCSPQQRSREGRRKHRASPARGRAFTRRHRGCRKTALHCGEVGQALSSLHWRVHIYPRICGWHLRLSWRPLIKSRCADVAGIFVKRWRNQTIRQAAIDRREDGGAAGINGCGSGNKCRRQSRGADVLRGGCERRLTVSSRGGMARLCA